jgi:hypothetical protein
MLKRKIVSELERWTKESNKKALLLKGARQVGKTTSVREFAKRHYAHFVEINFEKFPTAKQAFGGNLDANTIISQLSIMGFGPFVEHQTLVFFDEIQTCPNARTAIKFLVEDGRFDYIESGSLLGLNYADVSSYPVGFEYSVNMYPMDFEEFLWAKGVAENAIEPLKTTLRDKQPVSDFMHEQLSKYYREYLIVGGMPEVVNTYLTDADFSKTLQMQRSIVDSYRDDIAKYAGSEKTKAKLFFDAIPSELSKEKKRFIIADIEQRATAQKYENAAQWLIDAGIAYFSYNTHDLLLPFEQYEKRNLYKVFLLDTGLLCSMWREPIQWQVLQGDIDINEGALTENYVAAELVKKGYTLHYYDYKSRQELDFLIARDNKIDIIEVKSGNDYKRHASLDTAMQKPDIPIGDSFVFCKFPMEKEGDTQYIPLYALGWM